MPVGRFVPKMLFMGIHLGLPVVPEDSIQEDWGCTDYLSGPYEYVVNMLCDRNHILSQERVDETDQKLMDGCES